MRRALAFALALLLLPLAASASAGHTPSCSSVTSSTVAAAGGLVYVHSANAGGVWVESNDLPGLQRQACTQNGVHHPADTQVKRPEILGLCIVVSPVAICL